MALLINGQKVGITFSKNKKIVNGINKYSFTYMVVFVKYPTSFITNGLFDFVSEF